MDNKDSIPRDPEFMDRFMEGFNVFLKGYFDGRDNNHCEPRYISLNLYHKGYAMGQAKRIGILD